MTEHRLIRWLRRRIPASARVPVGPGDDAAVVRLADRRALIHVDQCVEGVHFHRGTPWKQAGEKAVRRCASDLAAMGSRPVAALVGAALPLRADRKAILLGLLKACRDLGMDLVGGDLSATSGPAVLSVTVLGELQKGQKPILRSGAEPGDLLAVTGALGGSGKGRHLKPRPRIREALALRRVLTLHAMIDLSDGLALDLGHLLDESRAGATVVGAWVPIHGDAKGSLRRAFTEGEDYELLFAFPAREAGRLGRLPFPVHVIGQVTRRKRLLLDPRRGLVPLPAKGYEHRWR